MTTEVQYSPATQAALERNDELAQIPRAYSKAVDIPHPGSDEVRALWGLKPEKRLARSSGLPSVPEMLEEAKNALKEKYYNHDIEVVAGVDARALWAATTMAGIDMPDSVESSLIRVDKHEERQARYRAAMGGHWQYGDLRERILEEPAATAHFWMPNRQRVRVEALAKMRGEHFATTLRFIIESGLMLADERCKRYEATMIKQLYDTFKEVPPEERAGLFEMMEADRYIDPDSPSRERAFNLAYPMSGAPPTLAKLVVEQPEIPKEVSWIRTRWY